MQFKDALGMIHSLRYACPRFRIFNAIDDNGESCYLVFKGTENQIKKFMYYPNALEYGRE
jgi:hypothetical protein